MDSAYIRRRLPISQRLSLSRARSLAWRRGTCKARGRDKPWAFAKGTRPVPYSTISATVEIRVLRSDSRPCTSSSGLGNAMAATGCKLASGSAAAERPMRRSAALASSYCSGRLGTPNNAMATHSTHSIKPLWSKSSASTPSSSSSLGGQAAASPNRAFRPKRSSSKSRRPSPSSSRARKSSRHRASNSSSESESAKAQAASATRCSRVSRGNLNSNVMALGACKANSPLLTRPCRPCEGGGASAQASHRCCNAWAHVSRFSSSSCKRPRIRLRTSAEA
mmetsp:Transcript_92514/g.257703  ORF Transcript_92514/g.257703 Transcript_92514/m.257703 type:complete len:279 (-) Transcript_92514:1179-2015(-)